MGWLRELLVVSGADVSAAEDEVMRRRQCAMQALSERRKREPGFTVKPETVLGATADDETRALIRRIAGAKE